MGSGYVRHDRPGGRTNGDMTESFQPADPNYRENVDSIFSRAVFTRELGIELLGFGAGWCETSLKLQSRHLQQNGFAHVPRGINDRISRVTSNS